MLLIRYTFDSDGANANKSLAKDVPGGIVSHYNLKYDAAYKAATLDLFYPEHSTPRKNPLIVWVHGGGFIGGDKRDLSNYCKILASKGYTVAAANYTLAPEAKYPVPVRQINTAVGFLINNADKFNIDSSYVVLAGDSGGAHISAQLAAAFTNTTYAAMLGVTPTVDPKKLKAILLYCGPYNTRLVKYDGAFGGFLKTVLWAYGGKKDFRDSPDFKSFTVTDYVTENYPKTFISAGNQDPLRFHSYELASVLSSKGVMVDSLFFPNDYEPGVPHEYQTHMDNAAGKLAFERMVKFLSNH